MQNAIVVALNHEDPETKTKDPERMSKIKRFINKYDWKDINYPSHR